MQTGEYITNRWLVEAIKLICHERAIEMTTYSDDWILELEQNDRTARIVGYKFGLNDSAAAQLAQDKVGTCQVLAAKNIPSVPHVLLRTKVGDVPSHTDWHEVVLKPLMGTSGHMVRAFNSEQDARIAVRQSSVEAWALSPRLTITREVRLIVLDDTVLLAYEKYAEPTGELKMFNLGQGATPHDITPGKTMVDLAMNARRALGLRVCAVDIAILDTGEQLVLEVNDGLMMEYYSRHSVQNKQRAYDVYRSIVTAMMSKN